MKEVEQALPGDVLYIIVYSEGQFVPKAVTLEKVSSVGEPVVIGVELSWNDLYLDYDECVKVSERKAY